ncbi:MAG: cell division protein FtsQ/DivIB [Alphaproteobacteria bacterium]|nr:cell division protein FtsQ/DivIB [Alphaproteobacteria bacterium]MCL2757740.1 cell division protein FtsQ/DivIB [Alphaproteobacteria bacterium]
MNKTVLFWISFAIAILVSVYFAARISISVIGMDGASIVRAVSIDPGRGPLSAQDIHRTSGLQPGQSAHAVDINEMLSNISGLSAVRRAGVRRMPSGRIAIKVEQREVIAAWTDGANFFPLSSDGHRFDRALAAAPDGWVVFSGTLPENLKDVVRTVRGIPGLVPLIGRMEWIEGRRWNIHTKSGIIVMLPESGMEAALQRLVRMQAQDRVLDRRISTLDMRDADRTLVKTTGR